jgi:hypothetical protein
MLPLTTAQVMELRELVRRHWSAFMIQSLGPSAVGLGPDVVAGLVRDGILDSAAASMVSPFEDAYMVGFLRDRMVTAGMSPATASWADIRALIQVNPIPLQAIERQAMAIAQQEAGIYATALGNRIENDLLSAINVGNIEAQHTLSAIQDETAMAIAQREGVDQLASRLAEVTGDYARDWRRLAMTELHNAQEQGYARVVESETGKQSRVAKLVNPDACRACFDAYTEKDGKPKIFTLEELQSNGTNIGRKGSEWLPVIGPMHPHCDCRLVRVPKGFVYNDDHQLVPESWLKEKAAGSSTILDNPTEGSVTLI